MSTQKKRRGRPTKRKLADRTACGNFVAAPGVIPRQKISAADRLRKTQDSLLIKENKNNLKINTKVVAVQESKSALLALVDVLSTALSTSNALTSEHDTTNCDQTESHQQHGESSTTVACAEHIAWYTGAGAESQPWLPTGLTSLGWMLRI